MQLTQRPFHLELACAANSRPDIYTVWFRKIRNEFWSDIVGSLYGRGSGGEPKLPTPRPSHDGDI
jgi:hypothetical protein